MPFSEGWESAVPWEILAHAKTFWFPGWCCLVHELFVVERYNFIKQIPVDADEVMCRTLLSTCYMHRSTGVDNVENNDKAFGNASPPKRL